MARDEALLIVDVQNDFCPGGALPVPDGDAVVPVLNRYARLFAEAGRPIVASRDWHPERTAHFREGGGPWPPHCIQGTDGAAFHPDLVLPADTRILSKGMDPGDHGYSAFEAVDDDGRPLHRVLEDAGIRRLYVGGLATDYCVRASVLDAAERGFNPVLLRDAVRGIDREPGAVDEALDEMVKAGASVASLDEIELGDG